MSTPKSWKSRLTPTYRLSLCGATDGQGVQELERRSSIRSTRFTVRAPPNFNHIAYHATSGEGLRLIHFGSSFFSCSSLSFVRLAVPKQRGGKSTDIQDEGVQIAESHLNAQVKSHSESQSQSQIQPAREHQTLRTLDTAIKNPSLTETTSDRMDKDEEKEKEKEVEEMIVDEIEEFDRDPTPTPRPTLATKGRGEREVTPRPAEKARSGSQSQNQSRSQLQSRLQSQSQSQARSQARSKNVNHNNDDTTTTIVAPVPTRLPTETAQVQVPALASQFRPTRTRRERVSAARSFVDMGTLY